MLFSEISPYVRYARQLSLTQSSMFSEVIPLDSRLFYCVSGVGKIKTKNTVYTLNSSSVIVINSATPYHILPPDSDACYLMMNFDYTRRASTKSFPIPPVPISEYTDSLLVDFNTFEDAVALNGVLYIEQMPNIHKKLTAIVNEYTKKLLYYEDKIGHMLGECLFDILRFSETKKTGNETETAASILSYIHENLDKDLSNISLGREFGYHPNYVNQIIRRATGISLHRYVLNTKMMHAVNLLENTSHSVGEIAQLCGFCDLPYFSQYFKRHFGIAPSKYR